MSRPEVADASPSDDPDSRFKILADAVAALCSCDEEDEVVEVVRASARALCGAAGIAIVWRERDECHYVAEDSSVPLWQGQRFPAGSCISGWAMNNGFQVSIPDIFSDPRVPHETYRPTGIQSLVMTPVGEPPIAALGAYWMDVREHSPAQLAVLKAMSECMAAALRTIRLRESLEHRLRESEQRRLEREAAREESALQARLLDVVEQAVIATDPDGLVIYWNAYAEKLYGWTREEAVGRSILDLNSAPDTAQQSEAIMRDLNAGKAWSGELTLKRKDGSTFTAYVNDWPVKSGSGDLIAIVGVSVDHTETRRAQEHQQLLINELNHRVKNTLAIVQSMAAQSLQGDGIVLQAKERFEARLYALAATHGLMIHVGWKPVPLRSILEIGLEPFGYDSENLRFSLDGPDLAVSPRAAVSLALAVHELGTNALKYGSLSGATGSIDVRWKVVSENDDDQFTIEWTEHGGPLVTPPTSRGFGSRLIQRGLASELGGRAEMHFLPGGLKCSIKAPASTALVIEGEPTALFPLPSGSSRGPAGLLSATNQCGVKTG